MITFPDFAGNGSVVQISPGANINARQVYVGCTGTNVVARFGDANVSSTRGLPISSGQVPLVLESMVDAQGNSILIPLVDLYAYIPSNSSLQVAYEPAGS